MKRLGKKRTDFSVSQSFNEEELQNLKTMLPDNLIGNSILSMIGAGLRVGELLALQKEQISEDGSRISVTAAVTGAMTEPELHEPKTLADARVIDVLPEYRKYVKRLRELGGAQYVWESDRRDSKLCAPGEFRQEYVRAMHSVNEVAYKSAAACRHTYRNLQRKAGITWL